jgi:hypothetical protein
MVAFVLIVPENCGRGRNCSASVHKDQVRENKFEPKPKIADQFRGLDERASASLSALVRIFGPYLGSGNVANHLLSRDSDA